MRQMLLGIKQRNKLANNHIFIGRKWWQKIRCSDEPVYIEPYCNFERSRHIWTMGAFSYSHSTLPVTAKVGRYCSIASDLWAMENQHPDRSIYIITHNL